MAVSGIYLLSGGQLSALTTGRPADGRLRYLLGRPDHTGRHHGIETGRPLALSTAQFAVTGACALAVAIVVEPISWAAVWAAAPEILYVGIFSSGVAFSLQIIGQRYTTPSQAAIFLSSEALFGASLGALLLGETMPPLGYAGCALMFIAMLLVEVVPEIARRRASEQTETEPKFGLNVWKRKNL